MGREVGKTRRRGREDCNRTYYVIFKKAIFKTEDGRNTY